MALRKTTQQFVSELIEINPTVEIVGEYMGAQKKIACRCKKCGHAWEATATNLLRGRKCPRCRKTGTSYMEQFVYLAIASALGDEKVKLRDKSAIGMELDIFVPPNFAVEIGSWIWHKDKAYERDEEKRERCREKGIELIVIYDSVPEDAIVPDDCISFPFDLAGEENQESLKNLARELIAHVSEECPKEIIDWRIISRRALFATGARGHNRFVDEMAAINPSIQIQSEYVNDRTKVSCACKACGHQWEAAANSLLQKHGCPRCAAKKAGELQRKKPEVFLEEVAQANPDVEVLGEYQGSDSKIACRCKKCGHEWSPWASSLRRKHGCPKCGAESSIVKRRKTHEQFIEELTELNPEIEVEGRYVNATTRIQCRCKRCECRWRVIPDSLLQRTGCPRCGQKSSHDAQRKTHEQFIEELVRINPTVETVSTYAGAHAKISCICRICGHEWLTKPDHLLRGTGCPKCGKRKAVNSRRKTHEQFIIELARTNPNVEALDRYKTGKTKIACRCVICGYRWQAQPSNLLSGRGCPNCKTQNFVKRMAKKRASQY